MKAGARMNCGRLGSVFLGVSGTSAFIRFRSTVVVGLSELEAVVVTAVATAAFSP
jgi:hypothetical protein